MAKTAIDTIKLSFASGMKPTGEDFENLIDSCFQEVTKTELDIKADKTHNHDEMYAPKTHNHAIADVTGLQTAIDGKLTATIASAQADSTATDVAGLVADFNALLAKLRTAKIIG